MLEQQNWLAAQDAQRLTLLLGQIPTLLMAQ
jgi:hypothetical protein